MTAHPNSLSILVWKVADWMRCRPKTQQARLDRGSRKLALVRLDYGLTLACSSHHDIHDPEIAIFKGSCDVKPALCVHGVTGSRLISTSI